MEYHEIPDAFPDDYRDSYPIVGRGCVCGHDEAEHGDGCEIKGCSCERFRDRLDATDYTGAAT